MVTMLGGDRAACLPAAATNLSRVRKPRWAYLLMLLVGAGLGVAIAGVPSRAKDPPLRVQTESTTISPAPSESPTTAPPEPPPPAPTPTSRPTASTRRR